MTDQRSFHRLDGDESSIILKSEHGGLPEILYWGRKLPTKINYETLDSMTARPVPHGHLDQDIPLSLYPEANRGFMGQTGISCHRQGLHFMQQFELVETSKKDNEWTFTCEDQTAEIGLEIKISLEAKSNILAASATLLNKGSQKLDLESFSAPSLKVPSHFTEALTLHGRWGQEFQSQRKDLSLGNALVIENRRGRTSHENFPGLIIGEKNFNEEQGQVLGIHLAWSGNYKIHAEKLLNGSSHVLAGELFLPGEMRLAPKESYTSPTVYCTIANGLEEMSHRFHSYARSHILPDNTRQARPVAINSWEAIYFDHDMTKMKAMIDAAASAGVERFVLDDGWFKGRRDDSSGLGDWTVDSDVYPEGLGELIGYAQEKGMDFGLWFEPEMVNPNSDLYRTHPDWILHPKDQTVLEERNQLVLNLAHPDAFAYIESAMTKILEDYPIAYVKWDMNRTLVSPAGADSCAGAHKQVQASYQLMANLRERFPKLEIESCSSGGGRIDFGVLKYSSRVWPSDNNDPVSRVASHRGFSLFFPPEIMASHVGAEKAHLTGRSTDIHYRAMTALQGVPGFETNLAEASPEDLELYKNYIRIYKENRTWMNEARVVRDYIADSDCHIFSLVSKDQKNALTWVQSIGSTCTPFSNILKCRGLSKELKYRCKVASFNKDELSFPMKKLPPFWQHLDEQLVDGFILQEAGFMLPTLPPQSSLLISFSGD